MSIPVFTLVEVIGNVDTLHEIVRLAHMDAQSYLDADLIVELVDGLRPICNQELLPKTCLLLALMPFVALRELSVTCDPQGSGLLV